MVLRVVQFEKFTSYMKTIADNGEWFQLEVHCLNTCTFE